MSDLDIMSVNEEEGDYTRKGSGNNQNYNKTEYRNARTPDATIPKKMVDITRDKPIKVTIRVVVPVRDHPKFNFVGKLLGPKGNSLKRLQEDTMTKMAILGRGSMRDRHKEEELRSSGDPKFSHLMEELHVEVTAYAPPAEAHARIAYALAEVRRFLVPDYNDEIRQEQLWEMAALNKQSSSSATVPQQSAPTPGSPQPASAAPAQDPASPRESTTSDSEPPSTTANSPIEHQPPNMRTPVSAGLPIVANATVVGSSVGGNSGGGGGAGGLLGCRKRPLVANPRLAHSMSPTKRTVLGILARARATQAQDTPQQSQHYGRHFVGIPGLREDHILSPGNILIN